MRACVLVTLLAASTVYAQTTRTCTVGLRSLEEGAEEPEDARRELLGATPLVNNAIHGSASCPSTCQSPTLAQLQSQFTTTAATRTTGAFATANTAQTAAWNLGQGDLYGGKFSVNYDVKDMCGATHTTSAAINYACNNPPVLMVRHQNVTLQLGAEVLIDARETIDIDDTFASLEWTYCLISAPSMATVSDAEAIDMLRTDTGAKGMALLMPLREGAHVVAVTVTDGCNIVQEMITINVMAECCSNTLAVTGGDTMMWSGANTVNEVDSGLSAASSQQTSCLPPDYIFRTGSGTGPASAIYKTRYSPVYQDPVLGGTTVYNSTTGAAVPGCTWPGASNFNKAAGANVDNGECTCGANTIAYNWPANSATNSPYYRQVDPSQTVAPVITSSGSNALLQFYSERKDAPTMTEQMCKRTLPTATTTSTTKLTSDLRSDVASLKPVDELLPRPSTSWDAWYEWTTTTSTNTEWFADNTLANQKGQDTLACELSLVDGLGNNPNVNLQVTKNTDFTQCLGRYTVQASSSPTKANQYCDASTDNHIVSVVCPFPPSAQILCTQNLLWDGTSFVLDPTAPYVAGGNFNSWVAIDARQTQNVNVLNSNSHVSYNLSITEQPRELTFNGAGPTGKLAGSNDLGRAAVTDLDQGTALVNMTGAFLPTRGLPPSTGVTGGKYQVTLYADDKCNPTSFDTVEVTTTCLTLTSTPTQGAVVTTSTIRTMPLNPAGTTTGPGQTLNYAFRVTSRPTFMGDTIPGGAFDDATVGLECLLSDKWNTIAHGVGPGARDAPADTGTWPTITATLPIAGSWSFAQYVTDGCAIESADLPAVTVSCDAAVDFVIANPPITSTLIYKGGAGGNWPAFTFATIGGPAAAGAVAPTRYAWFLTGAPAGDQTNVDKLYTANTNPRNAPKRSADTQICENFMAAWNNIGAMQAQDNNGGTAPLVNSGSASTSPSAAAFTAHYAGAYTFQVQGDNRCSYVNKPLTFTTLCNEPARFICKNAGGTDVADTPDDAACAATTGGSRNFISTGCTVTAGSSCNSNSAVSWDCALGRYHSTYVSLEVDGGSDTANSDTDVVTSVVTVTAPDQSWLSVDSITATVQYPIYIQDVPGVANPTATDGNRVDTLADGTNFASLIATLTTNLKASVATATSSGAYMVDAARVTISDVEIVDASCFVPFWGRIFTVKHTFTVKPPVQFAPRGTAYEVTPDSDLRPKSVFLNDLNSGITSGAFFTTVGQAYSAAQASYFTGNENAIPASATPTGVTAGALVGAIVNNPVVTAWATFEQTLPGDAGTRATSFIPDFGSVGTGAAYTVTVSIADDCPEATKPTVARTYQFRAVNPSCQVNMQPTTNITLIDDGTTVTSPLTRTWMSRAANFGDGWQYGGMLRPTTGTIVYQDETLTPNANADTSCSTGTTCVTLASSSLIVGATAGSTSLARLQGYGTAGAATANVGYPIANGGGLTLETTVSTSAPPAGSPGSEVQLGCITHATAIPAVTDVIFFHTFSSTVSGMQRLPIPDSCKLGGNVDLVLYQKAQATAVRYTFTSMTVYLHPTSIGMSPYCSLGYAWTRGTTVVTPPAAQPVIFTNQVGRYPLVDPTGSVANGGSGAVSSALISFQVQETQPSWINMCAPQTSSPVTVNLNCKPLTPGLTANTPEFNQAQFQFGTAELGVTLQPAEMTTTVLGDLRYTFELTDAPSGSIYNKEWIYNNLVTWKTRTALGAAVYTGPAPAAPKVVDMCYNTLDYAYGPVTDRSTMSFIGANSTVTTRAYANIDSIKLYLRTKAYPDYTRWHQDTSDGGAQQNLYRFTQNSTTCFQPDYSGSYTVQVTLDDGCVTPTASTTVNIGACTNPTVQIMDGTAAAGSTITAPAITASGPKRIPLYGTVNTKDIVSKASPRARMIKWTISSWPKMDMYPTAPTILNSNALYASFVPAYGAGDYVVTLSADDGCRPLADSASKTVTITVPCSAPVPAPAVTIVQTGNEKRVSDDMLTLVFQPNARAGGDSMELVGKPGCDTISGSSFSAASLSHTCTDPFSVKVLSVYPPTLLADSVGQLVQVTVAVGGDAAGIPKGLDNPNYRQSIQDGALAISIVIGGRQCGAAEVYNYEKGQIICRFLDTSPSVSDSRPVTVTILGISSAKTNTNGVAAFGTPMVTRAGAMPGSTAPAVGMTRVAVWGDNIAFDSFTNSFFEASTTRIKIGGQWCTDVMMYQAPVLFTSQGSLSCMLPAGTGVNLGVSVEASFRYPGSLPSRIASNTDGNVFTYDAPMAVPGTLSPATGSGAGGYYATVSVRNLGAAYPKGMPAATAGQPAGNPYSDVAISVGGQAVPADQFWVTSEETAASPATVKFVMPGGCGDMARVVVSRTNLATPDSMTVATFNYDDPFITCVGEPYVSATETACTRIMIDGYNLPAMGDSLVTNVTFQNDQSGITGYCDNVMADEGSNYFRFNCRIPNTARAGDRLVIVNKCGETNTAQFTDADITSHGRTLQTGSGSIPSLPSSINIPTCGASFLVNSGSEFTYAVEPPSIPASEPQASGVTIFKTISGGSWRNQPFSNGAWLGIVLPLLIILLLAYPIYHFISNRQGGSVHEWTRKNQAGAPPTSSSGAGASGAAPGASRTRVTLNPVSSRDATAGAPAAAQPSRQPAPAPRGTHDNL